MLTTSQASMPSYIVEGKTLSKAFRKRTVLNDVSFHISRGAFHALVGENGSGKTTLIKMLIGAYPPRSYLGKISTNLSELGLSYTPETTRFPANWSVERYLLRIAQFFERDLNLAKLQVSAALVDIGIEDLRKLKPQRLSSGQQKKVILAKIAIEKPQIIIMDEPAANLDFTSRHFLNQKLKAYNEAGVTIVIVSHLVKEIEAFVDEVTVIHFGKMLLNKKIAKGTLSQVYESALQTSLTKAPRNEN